MSRIVIATLVLIVAATVGRAQPLEVQVELTARGAVQDRIAILPVDLLALRGVLGIDLTGGAWSAEVVAATGEPVVAQTSLETDGQGVATRARVLWRVPGSAAPGEKRQFTVTLGAPPQEPIELAGVSVERTADETIVRTPWFSAHHDLQAGGLLGTVGFADDGMLPLSMNDRVYDENRGGWNLTNDRAPAVEVVAEGPLVAIVRTSARYCNGNGEPASGAPQATYEFAYSALQPTVGMRATVTQQDGPDWQQVHVFEMYHKTEQPFFDTVAWSPPLQSIPFVDEAKTHSLRSSASLVTADDAVAGGRGGAWRSDSRCGVGIRHLARAPLPPAPGAIARGRRAPGRGTERRTPSAGAWAGGGGRRRSPVQPFAVAVSCPAAGGSCSRAARSC